MIVFSAVVPTVTASVSTECRQIAGKGRITMREDPDKIG
jgi:hypothetical protein